jgi:hypothetical protein
VPCHHSLDEYLDAWIAAAGIGDDKKGLLFRTFKRGDKLTDNAMMRSDVLYMIKRRAKGAGLPYSTCCHIYGPSLGARLSVESWRIRLLTYIRPFKWGIYLPLALMESARLGYFAKKLSSFAL